jgi:hypothetical protein
MQNKEKCRRLAAKVEEIWREGLKLGNDALHYIDSTFSNPSLKELQRIIGAESNCERDSLVELVFFPDETIQTRLEEILEREAFQKEDEETVFRYLSKKPLQTTLNFPDNRGWFKLEVPQDAMRQFLSRLNIEKKIDKRILAVIDRVVDEPRARLCKVKLRNAPVRYSENRVFFLCSFFENIKSTETSFFNTIDFLLYFLGEISRETDIYAGLMEKKRFYFQNHLKAKILDAQLKQNNIETLLLQGVRIPVISTDEALQKMALIDRISLAVFNKTERIDPLYENVDLGEFHRRRDIDKVIRILS